MQRHLLHKHPGEIGIVEIRRIVRGKAEGVGVVVGGAGVYDDAAVGRVRLGADGPGRAVDLLGRDLVDEGEVRQAFLGRVLVRPADGSA